MPDCQIGGVTISRHLQATHSGKLMLYVVTSSLSSWVRFFWCRGMQSQLWHLPNPHKVKPKLSRIITLDHRGGGGGGFWSRPNYDHDILEQPLSQIQRKAKHVIAILLAKILQTRPKWSKWNHNWWDSLKAKSADQCQTKSYLPNSKSKMTKQLLLGNFDLFL